MLKNKITKMAALVMCLSMMFSVNVFAAEGGAEERALGVQTTTRSFSGTATPYTYRDEFNKSHTVTASFTGSARVSWYELEYGWFISADFNSPDVRIDGSSVAGVSYNGTVDGLNTETVTQKFSINNLRTLNAHANVDAYGEVHGYGEFK